MRRNQDRNEVTVVKQKAFDVTREGSHFVLKVWPLPAEGFLYRFDPNSQMRVICTGLELGDLYRQLQDLAGEIREEEAKPVPQNPGAIIWRWGKHKGKSIEELPTDYIRWALENMDSLNGRTIEELENQLKLRSGEGVSRKNV